MTSVILHTEVITLPKLFWVNDDDETDQYWLVDEDGNDCIYDFDEYDIMRDRIGVVQFRFLPPNKEDVHEFQYIDDVPKEELYGKHIFIDPGKRSLLTMMDDEGNFLSYTNGKRMKMTKRLEYQNRIKKYKDKNGITKIENELTNYSSKTCCIKKYEEYIIKKVEVSEKINNKYRNVYQ